jgi:enterochelin esterase family protein
MTLEFPQGAYVEYAFLDTDKQPLADLANRQTPKNPWYEYHRAFTLPLNRFVEPPQPRVFRGHVTKQVIASRIFAHQRHYYVYEPPLSPVATVYVHDGEAFYRKLRFHRVVEALIEREMIQPVRLVMIEPENRTTEYWFNEGYETFLLKEMMPTIERTYGETAERGLWGASLGGLVSVWLAWRHPDIFSKVASQSGCFTAMPGGGDSYHDPEWLTSQFRQTTRRPLRLYVETGQIEWLLAPNRRFAAMLADKGYVHSYNERPSGHNWATWEQGLEPGLIYLFPAIE